MARETTVFESTGTIKRGQHEQSERVDNRSNAASEQRAREGLATHLSFVAFLSSKDRRNAKMYHGTVMYVQFSIAFTAYRTCYKILFLTSPRTAQNELNRRFSSGS
jgi:hypothetical protein